VRLWRTARGTIARYAVVGLVNTTIDVLLFAMLQPHLGTVLANLCSTSAGMTFSFLANGRFTFRGRRATARRAVLFVTTTGATMWVVQPLLIESGVAAGLPLVVSKLAALGVTAVASFLLYRYVVWPGDEVRNDPPHAGRAEAPEATRR
jgi:putative flippase GtrA